MSDKLNIGSWAAVLDENGFLWASAFHFNGLFAVKLENGEIECVTSFEGVSLVAEALHREAYLFENEIVFLPLRDKKIRVYNRETKKQVSIDISVDETDSEYSRSVRVADAVYFMSDELKVWKYHMKEKSVVEVRELSDICMQFAKGIKNSILKNTYKDGFLLTEENGKKACKINLHSYEVDSFIVPTDREDLRVMYYDGSRYWFFLKDSQDILSWDGGREWITYKASNDDWVGDNKAVPYYNMFFLESGIYVSNYYAKNIAKINEDKGIVEVVFAYPENYKMLNVLQYGTVYSQVMEYGNQVVFVPQRGNLLFIYDIYTGTLKTIDFAIEKERLFYMKELKREMLIGNRPIRECDDFLALSDMIEVIDEKTKLRREVDVKSIGSDIFKALNVI